MALLPSCQTHSRRLGRKVPGPSAVLVGAPGADAGGTERTAFGHHGAAPHRLSESSGALLLVGVRPIGPGAKPNVFRALANHPQYCRGPSAPHADACVFTANGRTHRLGFVLASAHQRGGRAKLRLFPAPLVLADCRG